MLPSVWLRRHWPLLIYVLLLVLAAGLRFGALTQLPHTLWIDEAWFGLQGRVVLSGAELLPLRPPGLGIGNSAFQIYAAALVQAVGLPVTYSSRIASAVLGLLVVAATYPVLLALGRSLRTERAAQAAALVGTALVATNFAAILHSRGGLQMSGAALATVLAAGGLFLTFQRASWRWAVFTGLVVGLGQTTYEAALALPGLVVVYTALRWVWPGDLSRRRVVLLGGLILLTALAAFSPMLYFYATHPGIYLAHVGQTQTVAGGGLAASLGQALSGLLRVLGGLAFQGDLRAGRNLVGRPLFDPAAAVLVALGLAWALWPARRRPAAQILLAWAAVLALPSALSDDAPAFSRMLPLVPALAGLAGWGAVAVVRWAAGWGGQWRRTAAGLCAAAVLLSGGLSARAYFVEWPAQPALFDALYFGARLTAEAAVAYTPAAEVFVLTSSPPLVAGPFELLLDPTPVQRFDAAGCLPYADRAARDVVYGVIPVLDPLSLPLLQAAYPAGGVAGSVLHPEGYAYALFFRVPAGTPAPAPQHSVRVDFANGLRLVGYSVADTAAPGDPLNLQLFWQAAAPVTDPAIGFVHVGQGRNSQPLVAQQDGAVCPGFGPERWSPGYVYIETRALTVAADAPPGAYDVRVGLHDLADRVRYAIVAADVPAEDDRAILSALEVR